MFLFFDVLPFRKQLEYNQTITCSRCGHFGRYEVYLVGNRFRLFFIPVITRQSWSGHIKPSKQKSPVKRQGQDQAGENYSVILRIAKPVMSMTFSLSTV